jgi:hypothetical protein
MSSAQLYMLGYIYTFYISFFIQRPEGRNKGGTLRCDRSVRMLVRKGWIVTQQLLFNRLKLIQVLFLVR